MHGSKREYDKAQRNAGIIRNHNKMLFNDQQLLELYCNKDMKYKKKKSLDNKKFDYKSKHTPKNPNAIMTNYNYNYNYNHNNNMNHNNMIISANGHPIIAANGHPISNMNMNVMNVNMNGMNMINGVEVPPISNDRDYSRQYSETNHNNSMTVESSNALHKRDRKIRNYNNEEPTSEIAIRKETKTKKKVINQKYKNLKNIVLHP